MDLAFGMMSVFYLQEYPPEQPISAPVAPSNPSAASSADGANIRPVQAMRPEGTHLPYGVAYADDIMESWGVRVLSVTEDLTPADYQVATAAYVLWDRGLQFEHRQMTEAQQAIYHNLVRQRLAELQEVD